MAKTVKFLKELLPILDIAPNTLTRYKNQGLIVYTDDGSLIDVERTLKSVEKFRKKNPISLTNKIVKERKRMEHLSKVKTVSEYDSDIITINSDTISNFPSEKLEMLKKYEKGEITITEMVQTFDEYEIKKFETIEKVRKQKIDNDEREGVLISIESVLFKTETIGKMLKDRLSEIPNRCSAELASITDPQEVKILLKKEVVAIINDITKELGEVIE